MNHIAHLTSARPPEPVSTEKFAVYTERQLHAIKQLDSLSREQRFAMQVVSKVLPFRVNRYVIEQLIDWDNVEEDPIFRLTFPQAEMLNVEDFNQLADLIIKDADAASQALVINDIRSRLNPHPAGQMDANVPSLAREDLSGVPAQVSRNRVVLPQPGANLPQLLYLLFSLGTVYRRQGSALRD